MMIGPNRAALILEVGYVEGDVAMVIVHAMPTMVSPGSKAISSPPESLPGYSAYPPTARWSSTGKWAMSFLRVVDVMVQ